MLMTMGPWELLQGTGHTACLSPTLRSPVFPAPLQWEACNCVAVVFDISNRESFKSVAKWLRKVEDCKAIAISEGKGYGSGKLHGCECGVTEGKGMGAATL